MSGLYDSVLIDKMRTGVATLASDWGLSDETEIALLTISENATFKAVDPKSGQRAVLRVNRPNYHDEMEILSELAWIEALAADGRVPTAPLLTRADGTCLARFDCAGERRSVVAFGFVDGAEPGVDANLAAGFEMLGGLTAQLHNHSAMWKRPTFFTRKRWDFETSIGSRPHWGDWRAAMGLTPDGRRLIERCCACLESRLAEYGTGPDRFGLIHADLRLANLLVDGPSLTVIDFDDCGHGWYVYDFAAAVSFIETDVDVGALAQAWLQGYRRLRPLSEADAAMIPDLVMLRRILLTAWLASHSETPTAQALGAGYTDGTVALARGWLDTGRVHPG